MVKQSTTLMGLGAVVNALNALLPQATNNIAEAMGFGFSPLPTAAPMPNLFKRQAGGSGSLIGYLAPDNTCGYVGGVLASSKTCDTTESCAAVVVSGVASLGCCNVAAGTCQFLGNCIGSSAYYSGTKCGAACQADSNTIKCTAATKPYCYSYLVPSLTMGFFSCASTTSASFAPFATTYSGQASKSWEKLYDTKSGSVSSSRGPAFSGLSSQGLNNGAGFSSISSSSAPIASNPSGASTNSQETPKKSKPIGAIVGGVIGGLAAIGIAIVAILFLCIKKRNARNSNAAPPIMTNDSTGAPMQQQNQQVMMSPYQTYDPNAQGFVQNGYQPYGQNPNAPNYGYFGGAAAVGSYGHLNQDNKTGVYSSDHSVAPSPAPQYDTSRGPPSLGTGPSPSVSSAVPVIGAPVGYHEAPGGPGPRDSYAPSPQLGTVELAGVAHQVSPVGVSPPQQIQTPAPVELGTRPIAPRQNPQGHPVYEMSS